MRKMRNNSEILRRFWAFFFETNEELERGEDEKMTSPRSSGYAGLGASIHDSGMMRATGQITKTGRRDLRSAGKLHDRGYRRSLHEMLLATGSSSVTDLLQRLPNADDLHSISAQQESLHVVASAVIVYASAGSGTKKSKNDIPPLSACTSARAVPRPARGNGAHHFSYPLRFSSPLSSSLLVRPHPCAIETLAHLAHSWR